MAITIGNNMHSLFRLSLIILIPLFLASCTTTGQGVDENLLQVPTGKGLVLFSTGAERPSSLHSTYLTLVEGNSRKSYDKVIIILNNPFTASHFKDSHGQVRTLALPPGEYFLVPSSVNPYFIMITAPVYRFMVTEKEVTYIGNFHLGDNQLIWSPTKLQRDTEFFIEKNSAMSGADIKIQKAEIVSNVADFKIKGTIWGIP
ncbi:hypothetical protein [Ectopseudomonas alcaliphila]|uniref:Lipoprotein n=2 Tax=Ectopseudomonas alcaliphila TaxID=101564 RepID=A0ABU4Q3T4_9GAMM|nr:hypothetical protein [Pseudomonas alcaliphila]MDX5994847.1 hypothetical protein [Pseudomonas alcaliphila]